MRTLQSCTVTTLQHSEQRPPAYWTVFSRRILLRAAKVTASASWGKTTVFVFRTQSEGAADLMLEEQEDNQHDGDVHSDNQDGEEDEDRHQDDGEL